MNYDTTRVYSRSLSQAFADERAICVYLPPKRHADRALYWIAAVGLVAVILSVIFSGSTDMSKPVWNSGPPPSLGWWPVSGAIKGVCWWDGVAWSVIAYKSDSAISAARYAARYTANTGIRWRDRPSNWPARSFT